MPRTKLPVVQDKKPKAPTTVRYIETVITLRLGLTGVETPDASREFGNAMPLGSVDIPIRIPVDVTVEDEP